MLGPLTVPGESGRLGPRDRIVLAALAICPGQTVRADRLADAIWGELPPATWSKVVQGCVVRLRKVLGPEAIVTSSYGYRLVVSPDDIDSLRFERLLGRGRELLTLAEPERASYVLGEALALWRGAALEELDAWDAGRVEAARLAELRRDAEELGVDAALRAGRCREVLTRARQLVAEAPLRERRWALLALAQYQSGRQAESLRTIREIRTVLTAELGLEPGPDLVALERAILRQDPSLVAGEALPPPAGSCPYQGLLAYDVGDVDTFFGREADLSRCLARLGSGNVVVVVGPSGSGKSSLVRAGVAAALQRTGRRVVVVTPGAHPLDALTAMPATGPPPVLVVDQCEELVTLATDPDEQARFVAALAGHAEHGGLVIALRADRIGEVSQHLAFARLVERGIYLLGTMGADQLRACIQGPAHQAGLLLEPGLVDLLVREVEGEPGALPLLSHALRETWVHREGRTLTVAGYLAAGGIKGAVARSADDLYERLDPEQQAVARGLLMRLVAVDGSGVVSRSRVSRRPVSAGRSHDHVVELLVAARLVTSDDGVLELAHEALTRAWPRLREWLEDDRDGHRILRHLTTSADAWDVMGRPASEVYRGVRLAQALDWRDRARPDLTAVEQAFLAASHARVDTDLRAAQQQADREARGARRNRRMAGGLTAALVVAVVAAGVATDYRRTAEDRADLADANRLAALSKSVGALDVSMLLAAEAWSIADSSATQDGLLGALVENRRAAQVVQLEDRPYDGELADGGRTLFVSRQNAVVSWKAGSSERVRNVVEWDQPYEIAASAAQNLVALGSWKDEESTRVGVFTRTGEERLVLEGVDDEIGGWPLTFGFTSDGQGLRMLVGNPSEDGVGYTSTIREVDVDTGRLRRVLPVQQPGGKDVEMRGLFADDGTTAVSWTHEPQSDAVLIDLGDQARTPLRVSRRAATSLGFVPLPNVVAQRWSDGAITLYDHDGRPRQVLNAHEIQVNDVVMAPDGSWAASADDRGEVIIWHVDPSTGEWAQQESLHGHDGAVAGIAVDPLGQSLTTVSHDGTAILWDLSADAGFGDPVPGLGDAWISNRPETVVPGRLVVFPTRPVPSSPEQFSEEVAVSAVFLDPRTGEVVERVPVGRTIPGVTFGSSVAVSPDRTMVAVTYGLGTVVLDARTREVLARITLDDIVELDQRRPELVWCAAWTPDGSKLLLGAEGKMFDAFDGGLVVVDTTTWRPEHERVDLGGSAQTMEVSADGRLAVGMTIPPVEDAPPGSVRILDAGTLELEQVLRLRRGDNPNDVSFSPDGRLLASGGGPGTVSVFALQSGRRLHHPSRVHNDFVQQVEWLPDSRTVVTSGGDGTVTLYDAQRGLVKVNMPASSDLQRGYTYLTSVTAEELTAFTGERDGRIYSLTPGRWLDYACVVAGRNLSRDEWSSYLPDRPYRETCSERQLRRQKAGTAAP